MNRWQAINNPMRIAPQTGRNIFFFLIMGLSFLLFYSQIKLLVKTSLSNELYSHIILIPVVSVYLVINRRKEIFRGGGFSVFPGSVIIIGGLALHMFWRGGSANLVQNDFLSRMVFSAVICWIGVFVLFYGLESARNALFPLLFLFFMVPVPSFLMERIIFFLQICSAEVSFWFFKLTGVPIFREGFTFHLPGLSVEVAKQCGGIRSSLILFIVSILAGHLFLISWKRKTVLLLSVLPITVVKNGIRIVTLSLLGAYVDPRILSTTLHRRGGIPFFILALLLLGIVLWFSRCSENRGDLEKQVNT